MTQRSTNRYMQSSAQRQRYSQWARGRCLHKDPYLRRAVSQFVHKKHRDGMKKAFKTQCSLTCPQKAIDKYSYSFYLCLLFSLITQICPCVAKNAEGNWNNETYTQLHLSSTVSIQYKLQRLGVGGWGGRKPFTDGDFWGCTLYWCWANIMLNAFRSRPAVHIWKTQQLENKIDTYTLKTFILKLLIPTSPILLTQGRLTPSETSIEWLNPDFKGMHHVSIMIYLRYWNYIFTQDRTNNNITKKQSHTFCFLSFWWPVVLMGGTLGWGWARAAEEEEQLKLLAEFHLDPVAWKKGKPGDTLWLCGPWYKINFELRVDLSSTEKLSSLVMAEQLDSELMEQERTDFLLEEPPWVARFFKSRFIFSWRDKEAHLVFWLATFVKKVGEFTKKKKKITWVLLEITDTLTLRRWF